MRFSPKRQSKKKQINFYLFIVVAAVILGLGISIGAKFLLDGSFQQAIPQSTTYVNLPAADFFAAPEKYLGQTISVEDKLLVFSVQPEKNLIQVYSERFEQAVYVETGGTFSGLNEGDYIVVFGKVAEPKCFKNILDEKICQPHFVATSFQRTSKWDLATLKKLLGDPQ